MEKEIKSFDPILDQQLREGFSNAKLRLAPDSNVSELHAFIEAQGFKVTASEFGLQITRADSGAEVNVATLLNAAARKPECARQFILPGGEIQNLADFQSPEQRAEYIRKFGYSEFEKLVARSAAGALRADVVLHRDLDAAGYANLTRAERVEFITPFWRLCGRCCHQQKAEEVSENLLASAGSARGPAATTGMGRSLRLYGDHRRSAAQHVEGRLTHARLTGHLPAARLLQRHERRPHDSGLAKAFLGLWTRNK